MKILDEKIIIIQDVSAAKPEEVIIGFAKSYFRLSESPDPKKKHMLSTMHLMSMWTNTTFSKRQLNF